LFPQILQVSGSWGTHEPSSPRLATFFSSKLNIQFNNIFLFIFRFDLICDCCVVGFGAEKETEKLNNARQLLLRNDHNLVAQAALHLGYALLLLFLFLPSSTSI